MTNSGTALAQVQLLVPWNSNQWDVLTQLLHHILHLLHHIPHLLHPWPQTGSGDKLQDLPTWQKGTSGNHQVVACSLAMRNKDFRRALPQWKTEVLDCREPEELPFHEAACTAWTWAHTHSIFMSALTHRNKWGKLGRLFKYFWSFTAL